MTFLLPYDSLPPMHTQIHTYWHYLERGSQVDVIAPGYGCSPEILLKAKTFLESLGLVANIPETLLGEDPFCSHNDEERLKHLQEAVLSPHSRAIWCIRGGYGSGRLIPALAKMAVPDKVKLLIGFSDITALHIFFQQHFGWSTLHAGVLSQFCSKTLEDAAVNEIQEILFGKKKELVFSSLIPLNVAAEKEDVISAPLTGGNLSLIQTSIGTSWQLEGEGKMVLIEDVGERGYRIDRMLEHIRQSSLLEGVRAIIVGDITDDEEKDGSRLGVVAIRRFAASLSIPVVQCPNIGHGVFNHPLPLGTESSLYLGASPSLVCQTGGC